jgi:hypothetical protein
VAAVPHSYAVTDYIKPSSNTYLAYGLFLFTTAAILLYFPYTMFIVTLSTLPVGVNGSSRGENSRLSAERSHVYVARIERTISEMKGACFDDRAT